MDPRQLGATPGGGSGGSGGLSVDTSTGTSLMPEFNAVGGGGDCASSGSSSSSGGLDLGLHELHPRYNRHRVCPEASPTLKMGRLLLLNSRMASQTTDDEVLVMDGVLVANGSVSTPRRSASFTDLGIVPACSPGSGGSGRDGPNRQFSHGREDSRVVRAMNPRFFSDSLSDQAKRLKRTLDGHIATLISNGPRFALDSVRNPDDKCCKQQDLALPTNDFVFAHRAASVHRDLHEIQEYMRQKPLDKTCITQLVEMVTHKWHKDYEDPHPESLVKLMSDLEDLKQHLIGRTSSTTFEETTIISAKQEAHSLLQQLELACASVSQELKLVEGEGAQLMECSQQLTPH